MKKAVFVRFIFIILSVSIYSCRTIKIPEKWLFMDAKYDNYLKKLDYKKDSLSYFATKIIDKNNRKIAEQNTIRLERNYFPIDENLALEYFVFIPQKKEKVGVFFIGAGLPIFPYLNFLFELSEQTNSQIYVIHYRGYGHSSGKPIFFTQISDNQLFVEDILQKEVQIDFIIGYSIGSIFATHCAVENNIPQLYLFAPIYDSKTVLKHLKRKYTKGLKCFYRPFINLKIDEKITEISPAKKIENYVGKLVIFHGYRDKTLPYSMGRKLYKLATTIDKHLYKIPKTGHSLIFEQENWGNLVREINQKR